MATTSEQKIILLSGEWFINKLIRILHDILSYIDLKHQSTNICVADELKKSRK